VRRVRGRLDAMVASLPIMGVIVKLIDGR